MPVVALVPRSLPPWLNPTSSHLSPMACMFGNLPKQPLLAFNLPIPGHFASHLAYHNPLMASVFLLLLASLIWNILFIVPLFHSFTAFLNFPLFTQLDFSSPTI